MKRYFLSLLNIAIGFTIFLGIPYLTGSFAWLWISWLPAGFVCAYLEDRVNDMVNDRR